MSAMLVISTQATELLMNTVAADTSYAAVGDQVFSYFAQTLNGS